MSWAKAMFWIFVFAAIIVSFVLALAANKARAGLDRNANYSLRGSLFTPAERSFLGVLESVVGNNNRVYGKVRIADVIKVKSSSSKSWQSHFNRISAKHFDFVVCDASTMRFICAVELDDKTHGKQKRAARDEFVISVCAKSGLPLLRVQARSGYSVSDVKAQFNSLIEKVRGPIHAAPQ